MMDALVIVAAVLCFFALLAVWAIGMAWVIG